MLLPRHLFRSLFSSMPATPEMPSYTAEVMTVTLCHEGPVELATVTTSLQALLAWHGRFAERNGAAVHGDRVELSVGEIRSGLIVIEMLTQGTTVLDAIGPINTVVAFAENFAALIAFLQGGASEPPPGTTVQDGQDLSDFLAPATQDMHSTMSIQASDRGAVNVVNVVLSAEQAGTVQNRAVDWIALHAQPEAAIYRQRLFSFFLPGDGSRVVGYRGIIVSITSRPIHTIFADDATKAAMVEEPLLGKLYIVDVEVQMADGRPRLYRILNVSGSFDRDEGDP